MKVLAFGEAMIEISENASGGHVGIAGDTLNTAIYLKRSAPEVNVTYFTHIGNDGASKRAHAFIESEAIETHAIVERDDSTIGAYLIETDANGERRFSYWRDNSAARRMFLDDADLKALDGYDLIYFSAISLAILAPEALEVLLERLQVVKEQGCKIAFDGNYRPRLWETQNAARRITARAYALADIAFPSLDDEMALFHDATEAETVLRLQRYNCPLVILKRGEKGPNVFGHELDEAAFPPARIIVDTTAAGDSFNGGFLGDFLRGATPTQAAKAGHDLASRVIGFRGAILPKSFPKSRIHP